MVLWKIWDNFSTFLKFYIKVIHFILKKKKSSPQHHQHQYKFSRNDDEGFPKVYNERRGQANFSEIQSMKTQYVGKLAGQLNISIAKSSSLSKYIKVRDKNRVNRPLTWSFKWIYLNIAKQAK